MLFRQILIKILTGGSISFIYIRNRGQCLPHLLIKRYKKDNDNKDIDQDLIII